jgi:hypothetical protein
MQPNVVFSAVDAISFLESRLRRNEIKCRIVTSLWHSKVPFVCRRDDGAFALRFTIAGGTDLPPFQLSFRVGHIPRVRIPNGIGIQPKMVTSSPSFPISQNNADLNVQVPGREVIPGTQQYPREGGVDFNWSLHNVT